MCEKLVDVEEYFQLWRFRHLKTVERIIGFRPGTGGSSGVGFLRQALELTFFPELLTSRTEAPRDAERPSHHTAKPTCRRPTNEPRHCNGGCCRRTRPRRALRKTRCARIFFRSSHAPSRARHLSCEPLAWTPAGSDARRSPRRLSALAIAARQCMGRVDGEEHAHRSRIAQLIRCAARRLHPSESLRRPGAAHGAQCAAGTPRVVTTASEFDSVDVILKQYAAVGRIQLQRGALPHSRRHARSLAALRSSLQKC